MPHPHRRRHGPQPDRRRALELLASSRDGCTETIMLAHGFTIASGRGSRRLRRGALARQRANFAMAWAATGCSVLMPDNTIF
jgi:hypothetical protein